MAVQRTLTIIKPDAVAKGVSGQIIARFEQEGLKVLAAKLIHLSPAQAAGFYIVHKERPFYASLCAFMTQGPCMPIVLEGESAITRLRELMGATDPAKAAASSSAVPPISQIIMIEVVSGSAWKSRSTSMKLVPLTGSPPMPTQEDCPSPRWVSWWTTS